MAEVSQRLVNGAFRFSTFRNIPCRPVSDSDNRGSLQKSNGVAGGRSCGAPVGGPGICECQPVSTRKETCHRAQRRSKLRKSGRHDNDIVTSSSVRSVGTSRGFVLLDPNTSMCSERDLVRSHHTPLYLSPGLQTVLQVSPMTGRMMCWSRSVLLTATCQSDAFRSLDQLREYSTIILHLTDVGFGSSCKKLRLKLSQLHPEFLQASITCRSYSWTGSSNNSSDTPLLFRSKTAYYDILNVSPSATQSQVKTAYYKQSFIYHPDKNPGNEEATQRFSEISEAYTVLGNKNLRRKYDRGILSQSDVQTAGRPSSRDSATRMSGPQQQQQQKSRRFSHVGGKPMFDFDAFYQAHYGEQLQREKDMRARQKHFEEKKKKDISKWKMGKILEITVGMLLATGGALFISVFKS